jgi:hypothetical protein
MAGDADRGAINNAFDIADQPDAGRVGEWASGRVGDFSPCGAAAYSATTRALYSAVKVRRTGFAAGSTDPGSWPGPPAHAWPTGDCRPVNWGAWWGLGPGTADCRAAMNPVRRMWQTQSPRAVRRAVHQPGQHSLVGTGYRVNELRSPTPVGCSARCAAVRQAPLQYLAGRPPREPSVCNGLPHRWQVLGRPVSAPGSTR